MRAILNNYRQSPRKMRLVATAVKGKTVKEAEILLSLMPKTATVPLLKLLRSAVANAKENQKVTDSEGLMIEDFRVDAGVVLKRSMPRAHGSAYQILKRTSKVMLILGEQKKSPITNHQSPKKKAK
ncbi:MAG: 50S ribosomal protein L22 [Candidatus Taylorbacteria bacterium RIFCSPHIGHO2_01_FULL_51_15]|uniref:Large ribosomal subunit protein uL22 n=1 Tax=Candidatus Taylorbacteria bacterium RIFCSPHIGHO2_01_FULL_51_15 TaxID=1802304 RepID=A0A1G2MC84_9BACT|nr:MAG: 50S ribosomal protein L22 [Candidatus Taylorbacteria bacterium RIFCSPHIGHO2_01_FULL_51_15]